MFFRPDRILSKANDGIDGFLRAVCTGRHQTFDRFLTKEVCMMIVANSVQATDIDIATVYILSEEKHQLSQFGGRSQ